MKQNNKNLLELDSNCRFIHLMRSFFLYDQMNVTLKANDFGRYEKDAPHKINILVKFNVDDYKFVGFSNFAGDVSLYSFDAPIIKIGKREGSSPVSFSYQHNQVILERVVKYINRKVRNSNVSDKESYLKTKLKYYI